MIAGAAAGGGGSPIAGLRSSPSRVAVRLTPDALRQVRAGHPWVFDGSIVSIQPQGDTGDLAVVFDRKRRFVGIGLLDLDSPVRIKMLHVGAPTPIDGEWLGGVIRRSIATREPLPAGCDPVTGALRLVNGENDGLPGLVVDRYADVLVVKLYSSIWWSWLPVLVEMLTAQTACRGVVLRVARRLRSALPGGVTEPMVIAGHVAPGPVRFTEAGLRFDADVRHGQKTGHFLDQRANRIAVGTESRGASVLDVFCATGGFSVHAAAGGARRVHSVDRSPPTLAGASRNMALNLDRPAVARCRHSTEAGDAFDVLARRAGEAWDVVVLDPPSFAQRRRDVPGALAAYRRLASLAAEVVAPGGLLVQASCSSRVGREEFFDVVHGALATSGRTVTELRRSGHDLDHPIGFGEGAYLKAGFWRLGP